MSDVRDEGPVPCEFFGDGVLNEYELPQGNELDDAPTKLRRKVKSGRAIVTFASKNNPRVVEFSVTSKGKFVDKKVKSYK